MLFTFESIFPAPQILYALRQRTSATQRIYLVGGVIRDQLMGQESHDLDLVVNGDVRLLASQVANQIDAPFYMMDDEHKTARIIYQSPEGKRYFIDFARMRGAVIEQDLTTRDFTINAMAVDIVNPERIIDPLNGGRDVREKVLRACSERSMVIDAVRVLRAVRQSLAWGFRIEPDTLQLIKAAADRLPGVSMERRRDELFRILDGHQVRAAIAILDQVGALIHVLPELEHIKGVRQTMPHTSDLWEHTLATVDWMEKLYDILVGNRDEDQGANLVLGMAVTVLGRFRKALRDHYSVTLNPERSIRGLLLLAALYHDIAKPDVQSLDSDGRIHFYDHENYGAEKISMRGRLLALSNQEVDRLVKMVEHHMRVHHLANASSEISRRSIFRYFRALDSAGVDVCLLSLADLLARDGVTISPSQWERELGICRQLLEAWFERQTELVAPPRLLSGNEIMDALNLKSGPEIGHLLDTIHEAQAAGQILNRTEALDLARAILARDAPRDERVDDGV